MKKKIKLGFLGLLFVSVMLFAFLNPHVSILFPLSVLVTIALTAYIYDYESAFFAGSVVSVFLLGKILIFKSLTDFDHFSGLHYEILVESIIVSFLCVLLRSFYIKTQSQLESIGVHQSKLVESEQLFRSLAENIDSVFWISNAEKTKIHYVSPAFEKVFETSSELLYENPLNYLQYVHEEDRDIVISLFKKPADVSSTFRTEYRVMGASGDVKWVSSRSFTVQSDDDDTELASVVGFLDDITERKLSEISLKVKNDQLRFMNKNLKEFVTVASHDLQEPLRKVRSYTSILESELENIEGLTQDQNSEISDITQIICRSTERMQKLIRDLLEYSNLTKESTDLKRVDVRLAIDDAIQTLSLKIQQQKPNIVLPEKMPDVLGDQSGMTQIFQNLIENAIKYKKPNLKTQIRLEVVDQGKQWGILVHDNGIGMDEKNLEKIFEVFQRLHNRREYPGTGVGLAICRKNIQRFGGKISAKSILGEGSTFELLFPKLSRPRNLGVEIRHEEKEHRKPLAS